MSGAFNNLKSLGLTTLESKIYLSLVQDSQATAAFISSTLHAPVESVHRSIKSLKDKGFITFSYKYPRQFQLTDINLIALNKYQALTEAISGLEKLFPTSTKITKPNSIKFIPDRQSYHQVSHTLISHLKKEILIIASGTGEFEPSYFESLVNINKQGKIYRTIVMTYDQTNLEKLKHWQQNGMQIKFRRGQGFNLIIYDREIVQTAIRTTPGSREKQGFLIRNPDLASFLAEFHNYLWKKSSKIS
jgi:sugar-specific transcriptional regulator TrmB